MAMELSDDCWELFFSILESQIYEHILIALVSKCFLTISSRSRTLLPLPYSRNITPTIPPVLYARFPNLTHIILTHPNPKIDGFMRQLAASPLCLQKLCFCSQPYFPRDAMRILTKSKKETLRAPSWSNIITTRRSHLRDGGRLFFLFIATGPPSRKATATGPVAIGSVTRCPVAHARRAPVARIVAQPSATGPRHGRPSPMQNNFRNEDYAKGPRRINKSIRKNGGGKNQFAPFREKYLA